MEERKIKEAEFHDFVRSQDSATDSEKYAYYHSNRKFYEVARRSYRFQEKWLKSRCYGKKVLVLGCGEGAESFFLAQNGADVVGIDIADGAVQTAKKKATEHGFQDKADFLVMDAENLKLKENSFDIVTASGMIHHVDFSKVLPEILRVIKKDGQIICVEPLKYNPIFQLYRKLTPHLRTQWEAEHILGKKEIYLPKKYFKNVKPYFFHFFVLLAVPFRKSLIFKPFLSFLEVLDAIFLKIPIVQWLAWQVVFVVSGPKK